MRGDGYRPDRFLLAYFGGWLAFLVGPFDINIWADQTLIGTA